MYLYFTLKESDSFYSDCGVLRARCCRSGRLEGDWLELLFSHVFAHFQEMKSGSVATAPHPAVADTSGGGYQGGCDAALLGDCQGIGPFSHPLLIYTVFKQDLP